MILALIKNHAKMGWQLKQFIFIGEGHIESSQHWLFEGADWLKSGAIIGWCGKREDKGLKRLKFVSVG